jgi:hypothetical protein
MCLSCGCCPWDNALRVADAPTRDEYIFLDQNHSFYPDHRVVSEESCRAFLPLCTRTLLRTRDQIHETSTANLLQPERLPNHHPYLALLNSRCPLTTPTARTILQLSRPPILGVGRARTTGLAPTSTSQLTTVNTRASILQHQSTRAIRLRSQQPTIMPTT